MSTANPSPSRPWFNSFWPGLLIAGAVLLTAGPRAGAQSRSDLLTSRPRPAAPTVQEIDPGAAL